MGGKPIGAADLTHVVVWPLNALGLDDQDLAAQVCRARTSALYTLQRAQPDGIAAVRSWGQCEPRPLHSVLHGDQPLSLAQWVIEHGPLQEPEQLQDIGVQVAQARPGIVRQSRWGGTDLRQHRAMYGRGLRRWFISQQDSTSTRATPSPISTPPSQMTDAAPLSRAH